MSKGTHVSNVSMIYLTFLLLDTLIKSTGAVASEVREIKLIGAGFARTGTKSLKTALDELGYRSYHFI